MKKTITILAVLIAAIGMAGCDRPVETPENKPEIELLTPFQDGNIALNDVDSVRFSWQTAEPITNFKLILSLTEDFETKITLPVSAQSYALSAPEMDSQLDAMGVEPEASTVVYWSVEPWKSGSDIETSVRNFTIRRIVEPDVIPYEERVAEPLTIKVAVVYEDPIVEGTGGKRIHELYNWNNPWSQCAEYKKNFDEISHGVVKYEIVGEYEADHLYTYHNDSVDKPYLTTDELVAICDSKVFPGINEGVSYDYVGMINHFGFGAMRDRGELHEVWVYTHPASGMYESRLVGKNAFWCNSPGITTDLPCQDLMTVMFCNYERTVDLALHSYAHRVESIMNEVYGGWRYEYKNKKQALTTWEKFSAYKLTYERFDSGYAHIGLCHFPPNGVKDYDYNNSSLIYTYADEWFNYPNIVEDKSKARRVSSAEWEFGQYGYMKWYFGHLPHFKGLNPDSKDLHLNNWWYYIVDYNAAVRYERTLLMEL
ncbi:MAG: hypothetical protein SOZ00_04270 [Tidjanibacter sp.]|nr:hypothetical protein [Tidjanibacter sp.]